MYKNNKYLLGVSLLLSTQCGTAWSEGLLEDSKATFSTRNFYMNRDFRDGDGQSKREEWAQGLMLDFKSGYTPGPVGVGFDTLGMLGVRLDSSPDRTGTGLLPVHDNGRAPSEYSKLGLTGKMRISKSELRLGTLIPDLPSVQSNNGRLFPQLFRGTMLSVEEIDDLTFTAGRLNSVTDRDQTASQDLALNNKNGRFPGIVTADHFNLAGFDYAFTKGLSGRYHYSNLEDVYRQHFLGLLSKQSVGGGSLDFDLRLAISEDQGKALAGSINNRALNGMISYALDGHRLAAGYQRMYGDNAFPYLDGTDPFLVNFVQINDFAGAKERSWQLRYDYNFVAIGVPGLTFMTRYVKGDHVELRNGAQGEEWERNTELQYTLQSGPLKNMSIRWRNASYRSGFARDTDENRLIISYSLPLL